MKTRGFWAKVVMLISATAVIFSLVFLTTFGASVRRVHQSGVGSSLVTASGTARLARATESSRRIEAYGKLPLSFEENVGQMAKEVRYVSHGAGYELFLTPQEAVLAVSASASYDLSPLHRFATFQAIHKVSRARTMSVVRMRLEGTSPQPKIIGTDELPGKANYFIGNDPKKWRTDVPTYAKVKYAEIYPGVDLIFYGNQHRLEYDFIVAPGADPKAIRFDLEGARKLRLNARGDLVLSVFGGEVLLQKPVVYQVVGGERREIAGSYLITKDHQVSFTVPAYDRSEPLILDPVLKVLNYSTYVGGSAADSGQGIAVDSQGNAFIVGFTASTDFPGASGSISAANAKGSVFVTEINPAGTSQLYSAYLAGTGISGDFGLGIDLDPAGNIYVTGATFSTDFPTTASNALKPGPNAGAINGTSFVSKINPKGGANALVYSSYLGGTTLTAAEFGNSIAADANSNLYVTGFTAATPGPGLANFPITSSNAFQQTLGSANGNAFLTRIDTTQSKGASLIYSTYLGGNGANAVSSTLNFGDQGLGVAADSSNNAYLVGTTTSTNFPTQNAFQTIAPAAVANGTAFVSRIDTTQIKGASLIYSSYLGGDKSESGTAIALGGPTDHVVYVTGKTSSPAFQTIPAGAFQSCAGTTGAAFISLVDTGQTGSNSLKYSTCLGTIGTLGLGIRADATGNAYVGGGTSGSFPTTGGAFRAAFAAGANGEGFLSKLNPGGNGAADLVYSTLFGGSGSGATGIDVVNGVAIDAANSPNAFIVGQTFSSASSFPVFPPATASPPAFQTTLKGTSDAFVAKLTLIPTLGISPMALDFGTVVIGMSSTKTVTLTNNTSAALPFTSAIVAGSPAASGADYVATNNCANSVAVGTPCTVSVKFTPSAPPLIETAKLVLTDSTTTSAQSVSLTGTGAVPDFTISAAPTTVTVTQGAVSSPVTITVNPINGFNSPVALTCTGAPAKSSCALNPTTITPPTTSALTFTAHAMLVPLPISKPAPPFNMLRIVPLFVALMLLYLMRSTQRLRTRLTMVSAILVCIAVAGCSSNDNKPPKGSYPLTVTGTSGALTHSVTVTVTVD